MPWGAEQDGEAAFPQPILQEWRGIRICPSCSISREVALGLSGTGAGPDADGFKGDWPGEGNWLGPARD